MQHPTPRSHGEKIALTVGSLTSLAFMPVGAEAGIIHVTGTPITVSLSTPNYTGVDWDIDGTGGADFFLWRSDSSLFLAVGSDSVTGPSPSLGNGLGLVVTHPTRDYQIKNLAAGFMIGATMAAPYRIGLNASDWMTVLHHTNSPGDDLVLGDNLIGFAFKSGADTLYGWAEVSISSGTATINEWAYNDTPGGAIAAGDGGTPAAVPEPSTASLLLIGLGAGGVRAWRRRKQALNG